MSGYCNCPDEVARRREKRAAKERPSEGVCLVPGCTLCGATTPTTTADPERAALAEGSDA